MKYTRKTAGYTWTDNETNTEIEKELNVAESWTNTGIQQKLHTKCK